MAITTRDQLMDALGNNSSRLVLDKASLSNAAAGQFHSLWRAAGQPGQGAIPGAAAACAAGLLGSFGVTQQTPPATGYGAWASALCSNSAVTIEVHDRLAHMGGLVGNVATAQNVLLDISTMLASNNMAARIGDANYSDIQWWLEWYTDTGSTVATVTPTATFNDGTSAALTGFSLAATRRASLMVPLNGLIPAAQSGKYIRGISSLILSISTGTAGSFGVTATRPRMEMPLPLANKKELFTWADLGNPEIFNSSCLFPIELASTTSTGTVRGSAKVAHG